MIVGINGYGFIGYHLWVYLNYKCNDIEVIRLSKNLKDDLDNLSKCNVIIHMAEKNRGYPSQLYKDNKKSALHHQHMKMMMIYMENGEEKIIKCLVIGLKILNL